MPPPDPLASLLSQVPGLRVALLLDPPSSVPLARAVRDAGEDILLLAARVARLLEVAREPPASAATADLVVEAERSSLVLLHVAAGVLCLVLEPGASPARAAFEARRALAQGA